MCTDMWYLVRYSASCVKKVFRSAFRCLDARSDAEMR